MYQVLGFQEFQDFFERHGEKKNVRGENEMRGRERVGGEKGG